MYYRVAVTKTPEIFDIFEIKFQETTEDTKRRRGGAKDKITTLSIHYGLVFHSPLPKVPAISLL